MGVGWCQHVQYSDKTKSECFTLFNPRRVHFHTQLVADVSTIRVSIFSKNSRTGIPKACNFQQQVRLVLKAPLLVKNSNLWNTFIFDFSRTAMSFCKHFFKTGSKEYFR